MTSKRFILLCALVGIILGIAFMSVPKSTRPYIPPPVTLTSSNIDDNLCSTSNLSFAEADAPQQVQNKGIPLTDATTYLHIYCEPPPSTSSARNSVIDFVCGLLVGIAVVIAAKASINHLSSRRKKAATL